MAGARDASTRISICGVVSDFSKYLLGYAHLHRLAVDKKPVQCSKCLISTIDATKCYIGDAATNTVRSI
jgi:hypothetical protein